MSSYNETLYNDASVLVEEGVKDVRSGDREKPYRTLHEIAIGLGLIQLKTTTAERNRIIDRLRLTIRHGRVDENNLSPIVGHGYVDEFSCRCWTAETFHPDEVLEGWHGQGNAISEGTFKRQDEGVALIGDSGAKAAVAQNDLNRKKREQLAKAALTPAQLRKARGQHGLNTPNQKELGKFKAKSTTPKRTAKSN
jgi:hypothetical protein